MSTSEKTTIYKVTLLSCFDNCAPTCLMAALCWCFPLAQVVSKSGTDTHCFGVIGSDFWMNVAAGVVINIIGRVLDYLTGASVFGYLFCFVFIFTIRRGYRLKKEIKDTPYSCPVEACVCNSPLWDDVCVSFWCGCCSIVQMQRNEMDYEGFCDCGQCGPAFCPPEGGDGGGAAKTDGDAPIETEAPAGAGADAGASDGAEPNKV